MAGGVAWPPHSPQRPPNASRDNTMATDFFQRQDEARQRTAYLLILLGLGVLALIALSYFLVVVLFVGLESKPDDPTGWFHPELLMSVAGVILLIVTGGSLLKSMELSAGGKAVALMLQGREVLPTTSDPRLRRLLNVVEEMAIASGVPLPAVFVLPESGINAFAAGTSPADAVVAVSEGCLTYLTRDELQGVVAHEFSHILNADVRLNMRIIALIFGILAISHVGYVLMRLAPLGRSSSDSRGSGQAMWLLGLGLYLLGLAGAFFGWLIQAAVSRQREFLADASAVQFTRNPGGIAGALKKIGGLQQGSRIDNPQADEVSHMFFADAFFGRRLSSLLATHPPLLVRIRALDPQFDGRYPQVRPVHLEAEGVPKTRSAFPWVVPGTGPLPPVVVAGLADAALRSVGSLQPNHVAYAEAVLGDIPESLRTAAGEAFTARAVVFALLLDADPVVREVQLGILQAQAAPQDFRETIRWMDVVRAVPLRARLPLLDLTVPALRRMSPAQYQAFRGLVERLIQADDRTSLFEYALYCVLRDALDADFQRRRSARPPTAAEWASAATTVLSILAWEGHADAGAAAAAFAAGAKVLPDGPLPPQLRSREQSSGRLLDPALQTLARSAPQLKRQFLAACVATIQTDAAVTIREFELLRAISATLGCPMPPLVAEAA
ncbi:MAG: M48 family metallopeptidase [Gemmataceae bacterium]|nr:M48 family metallopeptidase [Gemmataceae bacterium]MDW8264813.1 M48 family metallopeptidase [Gemmataceae bacterium]